MLALVLVDAYHNEINLDKKTKIMSSSSPSLSSPPLPTQGTSPSPSQEPTSAFETSSTPTYDSPHNTSRGTYNHPHSTGGAPRSLWEILTGVHLFPMRKERISLSLQNAQSPGLGLGLGQGQNATGSGLASKSGLITEGGLGTGLGIRTRASKERLKKGHLYGYPAGAKIHWALVNMSRMIEQLRSKYTVITLPLSCQ